MAICFTYGSVDVESTCFMDEETEVKPLNSPWVISTLFAGQTHLSPLYESSKLFIQQPRGLNRQCTKVEKQWIYQQLGIFFPALSKVEMWIITMGYHFSHMMLTKNKDVYFPMLETVW